MPTDNVKNEPVRVFGIDFTSRPTRHKPITCAQCELAPDTLRFVRQHRLECFAAFERTLAVDGPWYAGIDFPFGQSSTFLRNIGWPLDWRSYITQVAGMERREFRALLDGYREPREPGDKEHRRLTDVAARAISPQKLYGVPVGLMFFEGAPRLLQSGATIPGLVEGDPGRVCLEAYPGVFARAVSNASYKSDSRAKQSTVQHRVRQEIMDYIGGRKIETEFGFRVSAPACLAEDASGDSLDALICAIQAAWAARNLREIVSGLRDEERLEGWIADPRVRSDHDTDKLLRDDA